MTEQTAEWQSIKTAPKDGTWFWGLRGLLAQRTQWGNTSHVPLYGWCYVMDSEREDPEYDLWQPTHWQPLAPGEAWKR